ncbi:hypothetical protein AAC387_Pa09g1943 [Persea americana]
MEVCVGAVRAKCSSEGGGKERRRGGKKEEKKGKRGSEGQPFLLHAASSCCDLRPNLDQNQTCDIDVHCWFPFVSSNARSDLYAQILSVSPLLRPNQISLVRLLQRNPRPRNGLLLCSLWPNQFSISGHNSHTLFRSPSPILAINFWNPNQQRTDFSVFVLRSFVPENPNRLIWPLSSVSIEPYN